MSESQPQDDQGLDLGADELDEETLARAKRGTRILLVLAAVFVVAIAIALTLLYWPDDQKQTEEVPDEVAPSRGAPSSLELPKVLFRDVSVERGLKFKHQNGAQGRKLLPETMGAGAAFFDYDGDGDPDLFLVNSAHWNPSLDDQSSRPALYRNDGGTFVDVSEEQGFTTSFYGMGVAAADYDEDGDPDLFVTAVGQNHLFRNDGGKGFAEVTQVSGCGGGNRWSTGAAFLDFDGDGHLDLFVCNYVVWSSEIDLKQGFKIDGTTRSYGPPRSFRGETCQLLRNLGDGKFEDVTGTAGVDVKNPATGEPMAKSLGLAVCDWNRDGHPDLIISNDTVQNFAFLNDGAGHFTEVGAEIGVAFDDKGNARGAMGLDVAAHRNDAATAIAVGNFANEMTAFYIDPGDDPEFPNFVDEATSSGIGSASRNSLTFGLLFSDFDLDGRLDLITANGHVEPDIKALQASQDHAQAAELFWNAGPGARREYVQVTASESGTDFFKPIVGRGLAAADIDGDGDLDYLFTENAGSPRLLLNELVGGKSLRLDLRTASGRVAWGTRVEVETRAGRQSAYLGGGRSYLSQSEAILTFGLAGESKCGEIHIRWANGKSQTLESLPAGKTKLKQP